MQQKYYILDEDGEVVLVDYETCGEWIMHADRIVARTQLENCEVSTVFLTGDHRLYPTDPPILFETMIFGGIFDELTRRYHTLEEAMRGHERMVALAQIRPGVRVALRKEPHLPVGTDQKINLKTETISVNVAGELRMFGYEQLERYEESAE